MKKGGSQKKGRSMEKLVAQELSLWLTNGERHEIFYPTSGSGSRFTARKKQGKDTANSCGDIAYTDVLGKPFIDKFSVEIKSGYSEELDLLAIIDSKNKNHTLVQWIEKCLKEIKEASRPEFMLIFKRNRKQKIICLRAEFLEKIDPTYKPEKEMLLYLPEANVSLIDYDDFFGHFSPHDLLK